MVLSVRRGAGGSSGTLPTQRTFTGQYSHDARLGSLMYFNARYMSPALGRFVSADTIVPGAGNPQAFNRYAFVFNNPLKYVDPSGNVPCDPKKAKLCPTQAPKKSEPPDPCKTLGLCQPPTNPQFEAENEFELEMPATFSLAGPSIEMATSQKKGGGIRSKIGLMLRSCPSITCPFCRLIVGAAGWCSSTLGARGA